MAGGAGLDDVRDLIAQAVARDRSSVRMSLAWRQLVAALAEIAREATHGRVTIVKTRAGLEVPGVAHADLARQLVVMSGYLWAADPDSNPSEQRPLLNPATTSERQRALAGYGVLGHEIGHHLCTDPKVLETLAREGYQQEVSLLEEPRMEASMGRRNGWYPASHGYAFTEYRMPDLVGAAASGDPAALIDVAVRTIGAEHGCLLHADVAGVCREVLTAALPKDLFDGLDDLCRDLVNVNDGDADGMRDCCERLRALLEEQASQAQPSDCEAHESPGGADGGDAAKEGSDADRSDTASGPTDSNRPPRSLTAADIQTIHEAQRAVDPADWPAAQQTLDRHDAAVGAVQSRQGAADADRRATDRTQRGMMAGLAGAPFDPVAAWREPTVEEHAMAHDLARRMSLVPVANDRRMLMRYPPGTVDFVQLTLRESQLARGLAPTADPFAQMHRANDRLRDPRVLVLLDTSRSMDAWIALATGMGWAVAKSAVLLNGRVAMVGFGNQVTPILDPAAAPQLVPVITAGGGTMLVRQAFETGVRRLDMRDPRAPRLLVVISDGDWHYPEDDQALLTPYLRSGMFAMTVRVEEPPENYVGLPLQIDHPLQLGRVIADALREMVVAQRCGRPVRLRPVIKRHV